MPAKPTTSKRSGIITLLTDFGDQDAYVASMKGVILGVNPAATLVDASHGVPPRDVRRAAQMLEAMVGYFPPGTVHLAVVDPGVGTARHALCIDAVQALFVGPDNGIFTLALRKLPIHRARVLPIPAGASATFHGRDVFAPAAARLSRGDDVALLGPALMAPVTLPGRAPRSDGMRVEGEVAYVDRFGNLVTNIPTEMLPDPKGACLVKIGTRTLIRGISTSYGAARPGGLVALVESTGHLEVAVRDGSAASRLRARLGTAVTVEGGH